MSKYEEFYRLKGLVKTMRKKLNSFEKALNESSSLPSDDDIPKAIRNIESELSIINHYLGSFHQDYKEIQEQIRANGD